MRLSADGLYYWDGRQWITTLSADGRSRWDGVRWIPVQQLPPQPVYRPVYAPTPIAPIAPRTPRVPTSWTRPLQVVVASAFGLYGLYALTTPVWLGGPMQQYMRQAALQQAQQAPEIYPNPNQYADMLSGFVTAGLVIGVIVGLAIAAVALVGTLRRWTWMYYAILVILGLAVVSLPVQLAYATGLVKAPGGLSMPPTATWIGATWGVLGVALLAWMLVALLTRGPWAMRKESAC